MPRKATEKVASNTSLKRNLPTQSTGQGSSSEKLVPLIAAGFGALVVLSFLAPVDSVSVFVGSALPQNLGWFLLAILAAFGGRNSFLREQTSRVEVLSLGFGLVWLIVATWFASSHGNGRAVWNGFWQVLALVSCYYIARSLVQYSRMRTAVSMLLVVGCTAMSVEGLQQVFVSMPATRAAYAENPDRILAEQNIDAPPGSPHRKQFEDRLNSPEPFATFALANSLATLLCLGVLLTSGMLASSISEDGTSASRISFPWTRPLGLSVALLIQLFCLLLTRSRTAYLALVLSIGVWIVFAFVRGKVRLSARVMQIGATAFGVTALIGFGWLLSVDNLVWSEAPKSIAYRIEYWQATLAMIREHAWFGVGLGNFQSYYPFYKLEQSSEIIADPHNWILDLAATLSVPVAIWIVGWVGVTLVNGFSACFAQNQSSPHRFSDLDLKREQRLLAGLVIGAAIGGVIAGTLLALTGNLDFQPAVFSWSLASVTGWLVWRCGNCQIGTPNLLAAAVVVLVCLLSSGSWQASGIAVPLLIVMAMNWEPCKLAVENHVEPLNATENGNLDWTPAAISLAALAIFMLQSWRPVTQSWMWVEKSTVAQSPDEQIRLIDEAVAADPLDSERQVQRVQILASRAALAPNAGAFLVDASRVSSLLKRLSPPDVVSYMLPKKAGEISMTLAAAAARNGLQNADYLAAARGFYMQAAQRYPSSVELLIQHAAVAALLADWSTAASSIEKAMQLNERIPHLDKKLEAQLIWLPIVPPGFEASDLGEVPNPNNGYVRAEPFAAWLRTEAKTKLR